MIEIYVAIVYLCFNALKLSINYIYNIHQYEKVLSYRLLQGNGGVTISGQNENLLLISYHSSNADGIVG